MLIRGAMLLEHIISKFIKWICFVRYCNALNDQCFKCFYAYYFANVVHLGLNVNELTVPF